MSNGDKIKQSTIVIDKIRIGNKVYYTVPVKIKQFIKQTYVRHIGIKERTVKVEFKLDLKI